MTSLELKADIQALRAKILSCAPGSPLLGEYATALICLYEELVKELQKELDVSGALK